MCGASAYLGPQSQSLEQTPLNYIYIQIYFQAGKWTNEIAKPSMLQNLLTRGSDTSPPTSARRESSDYDASLSTMPTSGADFQTRYAETQTNPSNLTQH